MKKGSLFGPVTLPASVWRRDDVSRVLSQRDVSALLRLVQRFSGVSQARLATAVGIGQGRMNEIVNGRRQVTQLDVFERIADGLAMPDQARVLMGLAPAHAAAQGVFTGHAEIAQVFMNQAEADAELRAHAASAASIDLLAVRALGLIGLNDSLLRGSLNRRLRPVRVRVLLLDPESTAAAVRAAEIGEPLESFAAGIRLSVARLREFADHPLVDLTTSLYSELPTWRMLRFDETLYLSAFGVSSEGHRSGMYKLVAGINGVLHAGFLRQYDDLWQRARHLQEAQG
jgi:transcriptional regulator with XRE-family HTH domain